MTHTLIPSRIVNRRIHMNGRVYDPSLGRMLSPDPITQAPENGQNYNRYSYAYNNPLKYADPNGFQNCELGDTCGESNVRVKRPSPYPHYKRNRFLKRDPYEVLLRDYYLAAGLRSNGRLRGNGQPIVPASNSPPNPTTGDSGSADDPNSVVESPEALTVNQARDILSTAYWVGLRASFGANIGIASFTISVNAVSHECDTGQICDGNVLTQGIEISGRIRGRDVDITLIDISRTSVDSLTWGEFEISWPSVDLGPASLSNGSLVIGIAGGFLVGGSVEYDLGKFFTDDVFGTCRGGARCAVP